MKKRHPLYWILERAEDFIDVGIIFAIIVIVAAVLVSMFIPQGHASYFDRY